MYVINKIGAYFCGIYTLVISALAVMESILRKVFASPTTWTLNLFAIYVAAAARNSGDPRYDG